MQLRLTDATHKLHSPVVTHWWSDLNAIIDVLSNQLAINAVCHERGMDLNHLELTNKELQNLESLKSLLEPLEEVSQVLEGDSYPTLSLVRRLFKAFVWPALIVTNSDPEWLKTTKK